MDLSAGSIFASLLVSSVGFILFVYGKRQVRIPQVVTGLVLMVYPYFIEGPAWILGIGAALVLGLWLVIRAGL